MLTDLQTRKLTRMFELADTNRDGCLEQGDFEAVAHGFAQARRLASGSAELIALQARYAAMWGALQEADTDQDGRVTLDEFLGWYDKLMSRREVFDQMIRLEAEQGLMQNGLMQLDQDGDGRITLAEHRAGMAALGLNEREAEAAFRRLDSDGDGYITREEMLQAVTDFYYSDDPDAAGNWLLGSF